MTRGRLGKTVSQWCQIEGEGERERKEQMVRRRLCQRYIYTYICILRYGNKVGWTEEEILREMRNDHRGLSVQQNFRFCV